MGIYDLMMAVLFSEKVDIESKEKSVNSLKWYFTDKVELQNKSS